MTEGDASTQAKEFISTAARIGARGAGGPRRQRRRESRFPQESIEAMREARLLGALVPVELGGLGTSWTRSPGRPPSWAGTARPSAMIFAMHHIQVACLVRHGSTPDAARLHPPGRRRAAAARLGHHRDRHRRRHPQLAPASSSATATRSRSPSRRRSSPTASTPTRSSPPRAAPPTARPSDQVLVVCAGRRRHARAALAAGTPSASAAPARSGFTLEATGDDELVLDDPFGDISSADHAADRRTCCGRSLWLGLAEAASWRGPAVRPEGRPQDARPVTPPGAPRLAALMVDPPAVRDRRSTR